MRRQRSRHAPKAICQEPVPEADFHQLSRRMDILQQECQPIISTQHWIMADLISILGFHGIYFPPFPRPGHDGAGPSRTQQKGDDDDNEGIQRMRRVSTRVVMSMWE